MVDGLSVVGAEIGVGVPLADLCRDRADQAVELGFVLTGDGVIGFRQAADERADRLAKVHQETHVYVGAVRRLAAHAWH